MVSAYLWNLSRVEEKQVIKNSCKSCLTVLKHVSNFSVFAHFQKETKYLISTGTGQ